MKRILILASALVALCALASNDIWYWQNGKATKFADADSITFVDPDDAEGGDEEPSTTGTFYGTYLIMATVEEGDTTDQSAAGSYIVLKPDTFQTITHYAKLDADASTKYVGAFDENNEFTLASPIYDAFFDIAVESYTDSTAVVSWDFDSTVTYYLLKRVTTLPALNLISASVYTEDGYEAEGDDEDYDDDEDEDEDDADSTGSGSGSGSESGEEEEEEEVKTYSLSFDLYQTLYDMGTTMWNVMKTSNNRSDFTFAIKDAEGNTVVDNSSFSAVRYPGEKDTLRGSVSLPETAGKYYLSATDPNGVEYKSETFEILPDTVTYLSSTGGDNYYLDLDKGVGYSESELTDADVLASIDLVYEDGKLISPDKCSNATVAATGNTIRFFGYWAYDEENDYTLTQTGMTLQFVTNNGTEGLITFVSVSNTGSPKYFSFNYNKK